MRLTLHDSLSLPNAPCMCESQEGWGQVLRDAVTRLALGHWVTAIQQASTATLPQG